MRIAMVGDFPAKVDEISGGVQAVATYLANALQAMPDVDVEAVTLAGAGEPARSVVQRNVPVHFVPVSRRPSRLSNRENARRMCDQIRRLKPDLVHAHIANQYADAARRTGLPWVLTAHGIRHLEMSLRTGVMNRYREWLIRREEFALMRSATHLISISPFITDVFAADISGDIAQIDNPVDPAFFDVDRKPSPNRVLYVGRVIPRKDIATLLDAFAVLKETCLGAELRIAGEGIAGLEPAGYPAEMLKRMQDLGIQDDVHFLGQLDDAELIDEYRQCALMVVSSVLETAPMVILQAMAAGVPVVSTDVGGIRYLIEHDVSGLLVPKQDSARLAAAMRAIVEDPDRITTMGARAKEIAHHRFHASDIASRTLAVYERALAAVGN